MAFSRDGRFMMVLGAESFASVWDLEEGEEVKKLRGHEAIMEVGAYDTTGQVIATGDQEGWVKVWTAQRGRERLQDRTWVWGVSYSPDGKLLAMSPALRGTIIWDADSGKRLLTIKVPMEEIQAMVFSPDNRFLVTIGSHYVATSGYDGSVRLWDFETGRLERVIGEEADPMWSADFSPDGRLLVTSSGSSSAKIWEVATGRLVRELPGHELWVSSARFTPDGRMIVTVSWGGVVRVWDLASGTEKQRWNMRAFGFEGVLTVDGSRLLTASIANPVYGMDFLTLSLWDVSQGRRVLELDGPTELAPHAFAHPSGRRLACSCLDFSCWQWDAFPWRDGDYGASYGSTLNERIEDYADDYWQARFQAESSSGGDDAQEGKQVEVSLEPALRPRRPAMASEQQLDLSEHYTSPFWVLWQGHDAVEPAGFPLDHGVPQ